MMDATDKQLRSSHLYLAGLHHIEKEINMEGLITVDGMLITTADMVDIMGRDELNNIALMLLADPDEALEEARCLVAIAVLAFCEATPITAVKCALENGYVLEEPLFKDRVKLGLSPSTLVENIDCR
jgi:hypothetical protein